MRAAAWALALAAMASLASAVTLDDCEEMGTTTAFTYDRTKRCYKGTFGATANTLDITVDVTSEMVAAGSSNNGWILWNAAQATTFSATVQYVNTRGSTSNVGATTACMDATCSASGTFMHRVNPSTIAGEHHFNVTAGTGAWGFIIDDVSTSIGTANSESATGKRVWVESLAGVASPASFLSGGFISQRIIVRDANFTFEPVSSSAAAQPAAATLGLPGTTSATTLSKTGAITTASFHRTNRPSGSGNFIVFIMPTISTNYFDWGAQKTPFLQGYITFDNANVAQYPVLSASAAQTMTLGTPSNGIAGVNDDNDIVELAVDVLWWNLTIDAPTLATVGADAAYRTGYPTVDVSTNPSTSSFTASGAFDGTASNFQVSNPTFAISNPMSSSFTASELAPVIYDPAPRMFARITRNTGIQPSSGLLTSTVTFRTETVVGSCRSYADCYADDADHPALRSRLSAGLTASRLRKCMLMPSAAEPTRPVSQCSECEADCDCGEGEYCHRDTGICQDPSSNYYTCDATSHSRYGLCVAKDPTNKIIGAGCRADTGATFSSALSVVGTGGSLGIFKNRLDNGSALTATQSGSGFCGGVAYYNESNLDGSNPNGVGRNSTARAILWQGSCLDGVCHECSTGTSSCSGARTCIQGRSLDTIVVDSTARTFTSNTVAGTMLGATLMIVLAIIVVLADCVCRHQWRDQDVKQRKLNEQRRKAKHHHHHHEAEAEKPAEKPAETN